MRITELLSESQGGIIRRDQEVAQGKNVTFAKNGHEVQLNGTAVIPEQSPRYNTLEELEDALEQTLADLDNPNVIYRSPANPRSGAALIVLCTDDKGQTVAMIKFAQVKKAGAFPIHWSNADFGRETGYVQTNNKVAERAEFNLKPNALLPTDTPLGLGNILSQLNIRADLPQDLQQQIPQLLSNVLSGNATPVPGAGAYKTTYEVDLGEIAAPIALLSGNFVSGSYLEAEQALLKPLRLSWKSLKSVTFPGAGDNALYDSYIPLNKNTSLKVSSKDKKGGAAASVTGLMNDIRTNPTKFKDITDDPTYQQILGILDVVTSNTAVNGPLKLAIQFQIIDENDMNNILANYGKGVKYQPKAPWAMTPGIQAALKRKGAKFEDPAYDFGFHILAGIAEMIADKLNAMSGISDFFKAVLERSTMVQVKTTVRTTGDGASFSNFQVIYPPVFNGAIKVVAGNNYMATRKPIGKISFKIP